MPLWVHWQVKAFDAQRWYADPITTVVDGARWEAGQRAETVDAFGKPNGAIIHASATEAPGFASSRTSNLSSNPQTHFHF